MLKVIKILSIVFLLAFASGIWIGCSNEPNVADPPDPVEMTVTVWPEDGATNVARDVEPTYTFSHELNNDLPDITVSIQGSGQEITFTVVKVSSTVYRIEFTNLLNELATYDMYLHSAKGKNGEILSGPLPIVTSFTTQEIIIPSLTLSVIFPPNNSEIPDTTSMLHYRADYDLNPATVEPSFSLTNTTTGTQLNPNIDVNSKDIYVNVSGVLEHSSEYTAEFDADIIRGLNGEKPTTTYSFSFTTEIVAPIYITPEGYLQIAGTNKGGYTYVGGIGPDDEGFTSCFDQNGETVWIEPFKVNGKYTRVLYMAATQNELYSMLEVKADPGSHGAGEVWLYAQSLDGQYLNKWQRTTGSPLYSITSSESEVYILYLQADYHRYIDRFSSSGLQSSAVLDYSTDLLFHDGYLYIVGGIYPNGDLFITKWHSDLSNSLWYRAEPIPGTLSYGTTNLTFAASRLQLLGYSTIPNVQRVLRQYNENGDLLDEHELIGEIGSTDYCSDDTYTYALGVNRLQRIDVNGNFEQVDWIIGSRVFKVDDAFGSNPRIAVTDKTNVLKLFE